MYPTHETGVAKIELIMIMMMMVPMVTASSVVVVVMLKRVHFFINVYQGRSDIIDITEH